MTQLGNRNSVYVKYPLPDFLIDWANQQNIHLLVSQSQAKYELAYENDKLQLHWLGQENFSPLSVDNPKTARLDKSNLLLKAIGKKTRHVTDLTAGLGVDAMTLALSGKKVGCLERSASIALLLYDGLRRFLYSNNIDVDLNFADSSDWLTKNESQLDAIYIDTMFVNKKKVAKSAKSMQILRNIAGDDSDADSLMQKAFRAKAKRIVIKHHDQSPVFGAKPNLQYLGKTVRFDVYIQPDS